MIEQNEQVVEETTEQVVEETTEENTEQPIEEVAKESIDESKFDSAGDDSVIKIDLDNPPDIKEEVTEENKNVVEKSETQEEVKEEV